MHFQTILPNSTLGYMFMYILMGTFFLNSLNAGQSFMLLLSVEFFSKLTFSKNYFRNNITVSNGLNPDQG